MLNVIKNPLVSVSDLKKSPMKIVDLAKSLGDGVYILNNNKDVGVVVDSERYKELINEITTLETKNGALQDRLLYLEAELRIAKNPTTISDKKVRPNADQMDLSQIEDEWE